MFQHKKEFLHPVRVERANPRYARAMLQNMAARDSETSCAAICSGCGRKNCPNRNEEENGG